jgi:hypothetical protein
VSESACVVTTAITAITVAVITAEAIIAAA